MKPIAIMIVLCDMISKNIRLGVFEHPWELPVSWVCDRFLHLREMEFHSFNLFPGTQLNLQLACSGRSVSKRVLLTMGIRHEPHPCHRLGKGTVIFMVTWRHSSSNYIFKHPFFALLVQTRICNGYVLPCMTYLLIFIFFLVCVTTNHL